MSKQIPPKKTKELLRNDAAPHEVSTEASLASEKFHVFMASAAIAFVLTIGIALRILLAPVAGRTIDEHFYTLWANQVAQEGVQGTAKQVTDYNLTRALWTESSSYKGWLYLSARGLYADHQHHG